MSSDRVQILDTPQALPGKCIVCGYAGGATRDDRKFFDIQMDIEFYGAVIFCTHCIVNLMNKAHWLSPEQAEKLKSERHHWFEQSLKLAAENDKLRAALNSLDFLSNSASLDMDSPKSSTREADAGEGSNDSGLPKSSAKFGSKNVPSTNKRKSEDFDSNGIDPILGI